jgi:uncharacterized membrane protein YhiD involved in acid resistance
MVKKYWGCTSKLRYTVGMMTGDDVVVRLFLSALFGSIVGIERELTHKSAGLRTHILVCLGSTAFMLLSLTPIAGVTTDPTRIAAQVVSGIGFIGGGSVLRMGTNVSGLTTAASLWIISAIGMLVGVGQLRLACICTLMAFLVLFSIGNLEKTFLNRHEPRVTYQLTLRVQAPPSQLPDLRLLVNAVLPKPQATEQWHAEGVTLQWVAECAFPPDMALLKEQLDALPGVVLHTLEMTHTPGVARISDD